MANIFKHAPVDDAIPDIQSAKSFIPEWYRKQERFGDNIKNPKKMPVTHTFKLCSAFGDSFTTGYIMPLPFDIAVEQKDNGPVITWNDSSIPILSVRDKDINKELPCPEGYSDIHFSWFTQHVIQIPKGYSALISHPLNRYDLPFITLSGVVDGEFAMYNGNIPVFFSSTFEGIIPCGTPIAQILLFKTESWKSKKDLSILKQANNNRLISSRRAFGWYKQNIWKKKRYD